MTVAELDVEFGDVEGYPDSGTKAEKVAFAEEHLAATGEEVVDTAELPPDQVPAEPVVQEEIYAPELDYAEPPFENEIYPHIHVGDWVRLGNTDRVPAEVQGHIAAVTDAPIVRHEWCVESPRYHEHQDPKIPITVQTRDQYNMLLTISRDDIAEVASDRTYLEAHG
jgi:hypothetical protein